MLFVVASAHVMFWQIQCAWFVDELYNCCFERRASSVVYACEEVWGIVDAHEQAALNIV